MKFAITGATGFIGARLMETLKADGHEYVVVTRSPSRAERLTPRPSGILQWGDGGKGLNAAGLEGLDGVFHLAGAPVAQRWTAGTKRRIEQSRIVYTRALVEALAAVRNPPPVLVSASAIGYYGASDTRGLKEDAPAGNDFLAGVCQQWEQGAMRAVPLGIRVVTLRVGIVIGRGGGALDQMLTPFRLGVGGPIGSGQQWMSWVHRDDVVGLALEAASNPDLSGPVNATAPDPVRNREFSKALGRALHRPAVLPIPVFGLKVLFGGFADILATGQHVIPARALDAGYRFRFADLDAALAEAVS